MSNTKMMSEEKSASTEAPNKLAKQRDLLTGIAKEASKDILVNQSGEVMLDMARAVFKNQPMIAMILETDDGRDLAKFLIAFLLQSGALHVPGTVMSPKAAEGLLELANRQMTVSTFLIGNRYAPLLKDGIMDLAKLGGALISDEAADISAAIGEVKERKNPPPPAKKLRYVDAEDDVVEESNVLHAVQGAKK